MGMDVFGKNPKSERGSYFRNNVWSWRPLANYILEIAPDRITSKCEHWHSNDGAGLNANDARELARILQAEIDNGECERYRLRYISDQERAPNEPCWLCEGTGTRKPTPERGPGDTLTGIKCNACEGSGYVRPWSTHYPFEVENVQNFVAFLRECGGFEIC